MSPSRAGSSHSSSWRIFSLALLGSSNLLFSPYCPDFPNSPNIRIYIQNKAYWQTVNRTGDLAIQIANESESEFKKKYRPAWKKYTGIPYAKPPIGNLRFKRPEPLPDNSWKGVFDASKSVTKCVQISEVPMIRKLNGAEDCLQLNVYVPQRLHSK